MKKTQKFPAGTHPLITNHRRQNYNKKEDRPMPKSWKKEIKKNYKKAKKLGLLHIPK